MKKILYFIVISLIVVDYLLAFKLNAMEKKDDLLHLNDQQGKYLPGQNIYYLLDHDHSLCLKDIQLKNRKTDFIQCKSKFLNLGFTDAICWIQFDIIYTGSHMKEWLLEIAYPHLDYIELYIINKSGKFQFKRAGVHLPFDQREINYKNFVFHIQLHPNEKVRLYLKVDTEDAVQLPIIIWDSIEFAQHVMQTEFFLGIFLGSLVLLILYNIFLFLSIQDTKIVYYIMTLVAYLVFQIALTGYAYQYLWGNYPELNNKSLPITILITNICLIAFSRVLIINKRHHPLINRVIWGFFFSGLIIFPFILLIKYYYAIQITLIYPFVIHVLLLIFSIISYRKGNKSLRFYIFGYLTLFVGLFLYYLKTFGILPAIAVTEYSFHVGSMLLMIQLSMTIVDDINIERSRNEKEQLKTLNSTQELLNIQNDLRNKQEMNSQTIEKDAQNLSSISDDLANNFSLMNTQSQNVSITSEEISTNISNISDSIRQIVESINNILSESNELSALIQSVSESIEYMSQSMKEIKTSASDGSNISKNAKILSQKSSHTIIDLKEAAMEIGKVTELIKRISDKTNLLSLNAAIEAVSAGKAGKGFAVVADAINKFADRSSSAADDIFRIISDVQARTKEAVYVIDEVTENINQIHLSSEEIFISINNQTKTESTVESNVTISKNHTQIISEAISRVSDAANDISRLVSEIDKGTYDVAQNIHRVSSEISNSQEGVIQIKETSNALFLFSKELSS